jgi:tetratricopeptide (TPR) repeat protein
MGWLFGKKSNNITIGGDDRRFVERAVLWQLRFSSGDAGKTFRLHLPNEEEFPEYSSDPKTNLVEVVDRLSRDIGLKEQVTISVFSRTALTWNTWRVGRTISGEPAPVIQVKEELLPHKAHLIVSLLLDLSAIKLTPVFGPDEDMGNEPEMQVTFSGFGIFILCAYPQINVFPVSQPWLSPHLHLYAMSLLCRLHHADHTAAREYLSDDAYDFLNRMVREHENSDHFLEFRREYHRVMRLVPFLQITTQQAYYAQETIDAYTQLIAAEANADYYNNRGYGYLLNGKFHEAIADFNSCIAMDAYYAYAFNNRAYCSMFTGDFQAALADLEISETMDPDNSFNYRNRGIYCLLNGQPEHALVHMKRAFAKDPKTEHIHFWLGKAHFALSDLNEARKQFELSRSLPELPAPEYPL